MIRTTPRARPGTQPMQITRIPAPFYPGSWVVLSAPVLERRARGGLPARVVQVQALACVLKQAEGPAVWRCVLADGTAVPVRGVERLATEEEVRRVRR